MKSSWSSGAKRLAMLGAATTLILTACGGGSDKDKGSGTASSDTAKESTAETMAEPKSESAQSETASASASASESAMSESAASGTAAAGGGEVGVALILKNTSNPFFVSMEKSAKAEADQLGVKLTVAAGKKDGDTDSQIAAIEAAVARGDKGILITPSGPAVNPALEKAKAAGVYTIALDTPPDPPDTVDITFATDNLEGGKLIGQWTAGTLKGEKATIAMLDLFNDQVVSVDYNRDQGFLIGMGIIDKVDTSGNGKEPATGKYSGGDYEVVCHEPTDGAADGGKKAMETCLAKNPDINVVYTINEPAAQGAHDALVAAGKKDGVTIVSVDGGCDPGLKLVAEGIIGATAQQYPGKMATLGMKAIKDLADGGPAPENSPGLDFYNTGVSLVTDAPVDGVASISVADGQKECWGGS